MEHTHGVTHWLPDTCFGCKVQTMHFAPSIFGTTPGGAKAADNKKREGELVKDLAAFKDLRMEGEQPRTTRGAHRVMMQAESSFEIESGQMAADKAKGADAGKSGSRKGSEWRRRSQDAHDAIKRGEVVTA